MQVYPLVYSVINGKERISWVENRVSNGVNRYLSERFGDSRLRPVDNYESLYAKLQRIKLSYQQNYK